MPAARETSPPPASPQGSLLRVLGVGFGLAVSIGGTIGLGILREPGMIAAQLPNTWLILAVWLVGGLYALMGTLSVAELGTMIPRSGGFYVFARRAFGPYPGFVVGWSDWLAASSFIALAAYVVGKNVGQLCPPLKGGAAVVAVAVGIVLTFALLHWQGIRWGSRTQGLTSTIKALALVVLVVGCFFFAPADRLDAPAAPVLPSGLALLTALVLALRSVIFTYDGWYGPVYFTEEVRDPGRDIPRTMVGGVLLVLAIYLAVNLALLAVLPLGKLAGNELAIAAAADVVFGAPHGATVMSVLAILVMLSALSSSNLTSPRILFAMSADGLFPRWAVQVNRGGTPTVALAATTMAAVLFLASGTFDKVQAILTFFLVINYTSAFVAVFVLRWREPEAERPYRAWGYPWTTLLALAASLFYLTLALRSDTKNSLWALGLLAVSYPAFLLSRRLVVRLG